MPAKSETATATMRDRSLRPGRATDDEFVHLSASTLLRPDPDAVASAIAGAGAAWLPGATELDPADGMRRFNVDLRFGIGAPDRSLLTFRKAARLDIGVPRKRGSAWVAEIAWRASGAAPLFPVFSGRLVIGPVQIRIEGLYAPPGGRLGRVADHVLLHIAAQATARWLLEEINRVPATWTGDARA